MFLWVHSGGPSDRRRVYSGAPRSRRVQLTFAYVYSGAPSGSRVHWRPRVFTRAYIGDVAFIRIRVGFLSAPRHHRVHSGLRELIRARLVVVLFREGSLGPA